ncbi:DUF502 domain-containing protein [Alkalibacter saccharofermentans]|uniref:Uncharacterized membrane protein n=1 Tax=Alkalibacter saccharofermentans DSM 14828 TaxID=1120975 RepID=A0A1M4URQ4_9FIRM|nr:DUF502 domain-containing protein [Alkalibacter saccharofermentans]SHE59365.1 Uncharacterized membrane protein [Alkalibacter saccharofermentans DSM 14828]
MKRMRQIFIRGLFSLLPIAATIYLIQIMFSFMDDIIGRHIESLFGISIPGIGIFITIILIMITGTLVSNVVGERLFHHGEKLLHKIPIVPKVYFGIKQIINAFTLEGKNIFNKVVLVEYPRKGTYVVGFLTGESGGEIQQKTEAKLMNVFIPTTPNPTSGMLVLVPSEEVTYLDMSVEEGLKLIVSAGVVVPEELGGSYQS